jgi:hypothetical protein
MTSPRPGRSRTMTPAASRDDVGRPSAGHATRRGPGGPNDDVAAHSMSRVRARHLRCLPARPGVGRAPR